MLFFAYSEFNNPRLYLNEAKVMAKLMDVDELARYLKLRRQTIYNWLHNKKIAGIKVGGVWRFDRREVDSWLKSKHQKSMA